MHFSMPSAPMHGHADHPSSLSQENTTTSSAGNSGSGNLIWGHLKVWRLTRAPIFSVVARESPGKSGRFEGTSQGCCVTVPFTAAEKLDVFDGTADGCICRELVLKNRGRSRLCKQQALQQAIKKRQAQQHAESLY